MDSHFKGPYGLTLKDEAIADAAGADKPTRYRQLDTGVLEALLLKGALGLDDDDISHLRDFGYARDADQALELVESGAHSSGVKSKPVRVLGEKEGDFGCRVSAPAPGKRPPEYPPSFPQS